MPARQTRPASAAIQSGIRDKAGTPSARGGRPTRSAAEQLGSRIIDAATGLFLSHGYGATSIEAVAKRARVSKRTFYHRFENKPALFSAVVHSIIGRLRPPADVPLVGGADLEAMLSGLASLILHAALSPQALALHRLIVGESGRFPNLAAAVAEQGGMAETVALIAGLLERERHNEKLALDDPVFAAQQFLFMVIALPQRRAMGMGPKMRPAELDAWVRDVIFLFLNGCRSSARSE